MLKNGSLPPPTLHLSVEKLRLLLSPVVKLLIFSFLISGHITEARKKQITKKPNVLFIVADDLGWNDVSWNNPKIHSPTLENLASEGITLDQYYVMPTCTPSRVAMMTGKYPYRVGRHHMYIKPLMPTGLAVNVNIMPQYFKQAGYTTHAIGKWHLGYCHQNYTPTYRGFDTFFGFYLGSQDYYLHSKIEKHDLGYDFRQNENILKGSNVEGKYSADLFVRRTKSIFEHHKHLNKPWFTYLSFQSVHDPLQVPNSYTRNICKYRDLPRFFYSAMVSSMDHAMEQVISSLKETGQYENTIIVFTTDNGGAQSVGGSNHPLRGTKGTLYEGGTRAIGFVHSPLLEKTGFTNRNLMHAVDWLPTLMTAIGHSGLASSATDGIDQWKALTQGAGAPREELVYNIKEKPFMAAIRAGNYKLIWGSAGRKDEWYPPKEEVVVPGQCESILADRTQADRGRLAITFPRGVDTADSLVLNVDEDADYWYESEEQERIEEEADEETDDDDLENDEDATVDTGYKVIHNVTAREARRWEYGEGGRKRVRKHAGGRGTKGNKKKKKKKGKGKKKNKGNYKRRMINQHGVEIKPYGSAMLFNLAVDPEERNDLSTTMPDMVEQLKDRAMVHFANMIHRDAPPDDKRGTPANWGGFFSPGWCEPKLI